MKLKSLLFATCAAAALVACSNDDDPIQGGGNETPQLVDAQISVGVTTETITKSDVTDPKEDNGETSEAHVKTLTLYLFDANGNYYKHETKTSTTASLAEFDNMTVKVAAPADGVTTSSTSFKGVLVANNADLSTVTTLDELKAALAKDITGCAIYGETNYLPMVSEVITFTAITPGTVTNWWVNNSTTATSKPAGTTSQVTLTRLVAKVGKVTLNTNFSGTGTYANSSFTLTNIHIVNVVGTTHLFDPIQGDIAPIYTGKAVDQSDIQDYILYQPATQNNAYTISGENADIKSALDFDINRYIYPNAGFTVAEHTYYTELLIEGQFKQNSTAAPVTKYYHIPLKSETGKTPEVKRNYVYNVIATLTGEGSNKPDGKDLNAAIAVKISVEPWNVVTQTEDDIN